MADDHDLPVDLAHGALALVPIALLLFLLIARRWKAPQAGPVALGVAVVVALVAFRTPLDNVAVAAGKGVWDGVFILSVIWPALLLYRVIDNAGAFEALRRGVTEYSDNQLFLVLGFGWVFASFLQGITGFGTPIAVVAPLLVALGVRPLYAVVIPLVGHAWANLFGTLAVAWLGLLQVVDLEDETRTAFESALLLWIPNLLGGLAICWLFGRGAAVRHGLPLVLVISAVHGGGQLALSLWNPVLANFLATTVALVALYPLSHWPRYSDPWRHDGQAPGMQREDRTERDVEPEPVMGLGRALVPYLVLTVVALAVLLITPVEERLDDLEVGPPFPEVETGYDLAQDEEESYSPFAPLTHPGMFLLVAALAAWLTFRAAGAYAHWKEQGEHEPLGRAVVGDAAPASVAVVALLVLSKVMDHSGQSDVLALGAAEIAPAGVYAFLAVWVGILGSFMTSSNTSSNVLFGPLQQTVAEAEGLAEPGILAAQGAGGAIGNAISPANVVLGTGAAGNVGEEGTVLRKVLPFAAMAGAVTGAAAVVLAL